MPSKTSKLSKLLKLRKQRELVLVAKVLQCKNETLRIETELAKIGDDILAFNASRPKEQENEFQKIANQIIHRDKLNQYFKVLEQLNQTEVTLESKKQAIEKELTEAQVKLDKTTKQRNAATQAKIKLNEIITELLVIEKDEANLQQEIESDDQSQSTHFNKRAKYF